MPKNILITGAAKRIGAECTRFLHQQGHNIILHYRHSKMSAQKLAQELNQQRANSVIIFQANLLIETELCQLASFANAHWEGVDVLINNASDFYPQAVAEVTRTDWQQIMDCNVTAPFFLSQALATTLSRRQGCIVNIIDVHAERGLKNYPVYSLSKASLAAMTKILAKEFAPDIRVNGVSPGAILWPETKPTETEQTDIMEKIALKSLGNPTDIAKTVSFLIDSAPYITGQIISVDGGRNLYS